MKAKVIGGSIGEIGNLTDVLQGFNPHQVLNDYGNDFEKLLNKIEQELKPAGQFRTESRSLWPGYCKTVLSAARFFSQLASGKDFYFIQIELAKLIEARSFSSYKKIASQKSDNIIIAILRNLFNCEGFYSRLHISATSGHPFQ